MGRDMRQPNRTVNISDDIENRVRVCWNTKLRAAVELKRRWVHERNWALFRFQLTCNLNGFVCANRCLPGNAKTFFVVRGRPFIFLVWNNLMIHFSSWRCYHEVQHFRVSFHLETSASCTKIYTSRTISGHHNFYNFRRGLAQKQCIDDLFWLLGIKHH